VLGALIIPASLLIAPSYRLLWQLGLLNSYAGLILPALAPAFGVFLFRQAMLNTVPKELQESARIDGAGELRIFFTIVVPLVRPMIGAFLMITFLAAWNNFIGPQIVLQQPEIFPLSVTINNLRGIYATDYGLIMSGTLLSIAPVMCLFLLLQKEFISGLTSGAVKG
jgi:multiple sugar transport system permease protein